MSEGLRLDSERCVGCMLCLAACPTGALDWRDEGEGLLGRMRSLLAVEPGGTGTKWERGAAGLSFACQENDSLYGKNESRLSVPCIGCVSPSLILLAVAWGAGDVLLDNRSCRSCSWGAGPALAARSLRQAMRTLDILSGSNAPALTPGPNPPDYSSVSRRKFFSRLGRRLGEAAVLALLPEDGPQPRAVPKQSALPRERSRLALAVGLLGPPRILWAEATDLPFYPLEAAGERCDGCAFCARFCPTGALESSEAGEEWRLAFRLSRCPGCGLCLETCPQEALSWSGLVDSSQMSGGESLLVRGTSRLCPACRKATVRAAGESLCSRCKSEKESEESYLELVKG